MPAAIRSVKTAPWFGSSDQAPARDSKKARPRARNVPRGIRLEGLVEVIGALPVAPERHILGFQIRQLGNRLKGLVGRNLRRRPRVTALRGG
jgi:hypothetical protein